MIEMEHDAPIRAFQIVLPAMEGARVDVASSIIESVGAGGWAGGGAETESATVVFGTRSTTASVAVPLSGGSDSRHELRILVYRPDGALIPPGSMHLATSGVTGRPRYVTVIGEERDRLRIDDNVWTSTEDALPSTVLPGMPYPNPFRAGSDMLQIPVGANSRSVIVYDLLGRVVQRIATDGTDLTWDGVDASGRVVGSGLYLVRIEGEHDSYTRAVQVLH